uniref:Uncharacterized protein n=1 Tax=Kalanchoe fedtschenkoi TaxID=63787 RepID=A0A7N0V288_KALFE
MGIKNILSERKSRYFLSVQQLVIRCPAVSAPDYWRPPGLISSCNFKLKMRSSGRLQHDRYKGPNLDAYCCYQQTSDRRSLAG